VLGGGKGRMLTFAKQTGYNVLVFDPVQSQPLELPMDKLWRFDMSRPCTSWL
jgi:hypothetical protein